MEDLAAHDSWGSHVGSFQLSCIMIVGLHRPTLTMSIVCQESVWILSKLRKSGNTNSQLSISKLFVHLWIYFFGVSSKPTDSFSIQVVSKHMRIDSKINMRTKTRAWDFLYSSETCWSTDLLIFIKFLKFFAKFLKILIFKKSWIFKVIWWTL